MNYKRNGNWTCLHKLKKKYCFVSCIVIIWNIFAIFLVLRPYLAAKYSRDNNEIQTDKSRR